MYNTEVWLSPGMIEVVEPGYEVVSTCTINVPCDRQFRLGT